MKIGILQIRHLIIRGSLHLPKELIKNYPNDSKRPNSRFSFSMKNLKNCVSIIYEGISTELALSLPDVQFYLDFCICR